MVGGGDGSNVCTMRASNDHHAEHVSVVVNVDIVIALVVMAKGGVLTFGLVVGECGGV
jgi:hypothetical protein